MDGFIPTGNEEDYYDINLLPTPIIYQQEIEEPTQQGPQDFQQYPIEQPQITEQQGMQQEPQIQQPEQQMIQQMIFQQPTEQINPQQYVQQSFLVTEPQYVQQYDFSGQLPNQAPIVQNITAAVENPIVSGTDIYYKEGNMKLASEYWEKALDTDKIRLKISTLKSIYKRVLETNDYEQAHTLLIKINTLNDSVEKSLKTKEIAELQYKYDASKKEKEYFHEKSRLYLMLLVLLLIVFTSVIIIFIYRRRIKTYLEEIKQHTKKAEDLDRRIARKEQQIKARERSIKELEKEKDKLITEKDKIVLKHKDNLRIGNCIYDSIRNGESIPTDNPKSEACLVEYFKTVHPEKVTAWDEQYEQLTKRQTVYLILKDLQYDDNKIKEILSCSGNALRVMKSRIKLIQKV